MNLLLKPTYWIIGICLIGGAIAYDLDKATAQSVSIDGTLGEAKTLQGPTYVIQQVDGQTVGNNLFHSFERFGLNAGEIAVFQSNANISNILSRVTGNIPSFIDGLIQTTSNLYLINPNGIIFGANAQLNIGGSFVASTANSIRFADGREFSATDKTQKPLLTITAPSGLGFKETVAPIDIQGSLLVTRTGQDITFSGGDITVQQSLLLTINGDMTFESKGNLNLNESYVVSMGLGETTSDYGGNINLTANSISLLNSGVINAAFGIAPSGNINVNANETINIISTDSTSTTNQINIISDFFQQLASIDLSNFLANFLREISGSGIGIITDGIGNAGYMNVNAKNLIIQNQSNRLTGFSILKRFPVETLGGDIFVNVDESIEIVGNQPGVFTPDLNQPARETFRNITTGIRTGNLDAGVPGNITINTKRLSIRDGAAIFSGSETTPNSSLKPIFDGGTLTINVTDLIDFQGLAGLQTGSTGTRNAGALIVNVPNGKIFLRDGAFIAADTVGSANAGQLMINTDELSLSNGSIIAARSRGEGNAGNINITARNLILNRGAIATTGTSGNGGDLQFQIQDLLLLQNQSQISTTAGTEESGGGNGGNININANFIVAVPEENNDIAANAFAGKGGNININSNSIFGLAFKNQPTSRSDITATSQLGLSGVVSINTPDTDTLSGLEKLSSTPVDVEKIIAKNICEFKNNQVAGESSFVIRGKGGLPQNPDEPPVPLTEFVEWATATSEDYEQISTRPLTETKERIVQPIQGWIKKADGTVILTAQSPTVTPQNPMLTSPDCKEKES